MRILLAIVVGGFVREQGGKDGGAKVLHAGDDSFGRILDVPTSFELREHVFDELVDALVKVAGAGGAEVFDFLER